MSLRILFIFILCATFYTGFIEPQWLYVNVKDMRSDKNKDPIRVVQLSDLHIQKIGRRETKVIDHLKALEADLLVLSGDVIDREDHLPILHSFLSELGEMPAIAVLGNWEHWAGLDIKTLYEEYEHHNVRLLVNDLTSFQIRQRSIKVFGIDDFTAGQPNFDLLQYASNEELTLLVQHSPGFFDNLPAGPNSQLLDLCLAGHTHGGQVTLFGRPLWVPPGSGNFSSGRYQTPACELFVSKGIGTSILPIRFWARPEISVFDL